MKRYTQIQWWIPAVLFCMGLMWTAQAASPGSLRDPAKTVLSDYTQIQKALADDSMKDVAAKAHDIARAVREDQGKTMSLSVAERAEQLAKAQDLKAARAAFKPLSESLVLYLSENKAKSTGLNEVYCPMAKASWLQEGEKIQNPYMGKSMLTCGEIRQSF